MAMVLVWYPKEVGSGVRVKEVARRRGDLDQLGQYLDSRLNVGHASLLLDRLKRPIYISWWPQNPATATPSYRSDISDEGGNPNVMVSIDELDEWAIESWWKTLVKSRSGPRGDYDFKDNNCSSVVAKALSVGGAEKLARKPTVSMWTPARVEEWASSILQAGKAKTNGIYRHQGIENFVDSTLRKMVSEIGVSMLGR